MHYTVTATGVRADKDFVRANPTLVTKHETGGAAAKGAYLPARPARTSLPPAVRCCPPAARPRSLRSLGRSAKRGGAAAALHCALLSERGTYLTHP